MSEKYREYGYDVNSNELSGQIQEDIKEAKEIENRAKEIRNKKGEEIAKEELDKEEVSLDEIEAALSNYVPKDDEYLVDGAILTCDKAKRGSIKVNLGNTVVEFEGNNANSFKYTRLYVPERAQKDNELCVATIEDTVYGEEEGNNILPFRCNCSLLPDREWEINKIKKNMAYCKTYGTCGQLMKLNDEWENLPSSVKGFTYVDKNGEKERINMMSMLFCRHGGLITPVSSGQIKEVLEELILIYETEKGAVVSGKSGETAPGAQAGVPVRYNVSTYLGKDCFGKSSPCYYIVNHDNTYVDENGLVRISKVSGYKTESDYYCVAMAPGFITKAEEYCMPAEENNINYGYKLQVLFNDEVGNEYSMDVVVTTVKASSDLTDYYPHDNLVEFVVDSKPKDTVTDSTGNVSFDILLGGDGLEIKEVYAYRDGAMITGNYRNGGYWEDRQ